MIKWLVNFHTNWIIINKIIVIKFSWWFDEFFLLKITWTSEPFRKPIWPISLSAMASIDLVSVSEIFDPFHSDITLLLHVHTFFNKMYIKCILRGTYNWSCTLWRVFQRRLLLYFRGILGTQIHPAKMHNPSKSKQRT